MTTISRQHAGMVRALVKPPVTILDSLTPRDVNITHMLLGISGEAGEIVDTLKKTIIYGKPLDIKHIVEELGDLEFYLEGLRQSLDISREECLLNNIAKLSTRYSDMNYSDEAAIARADKA